MNRPERIVTLDILRGLALFGMIVVHFHQRMESPAASATEDLVGWVIWVGIEQKAWATFALLFGAGFAILMRSWEARGMNVIPMFLRRMLLLGIIGIVVEKVTGFSILLEYAIWGVPLLFIRHWPTRWLLALALLATIGSSLVHVPRSFRILFPGSSFVLFIIGLLAVRHAIFENPAGQRRIIFVAMISGLISWAAWWLVLRDTGFDHGFGIIRDQWLGFTYVGAAILFLAYRPEWKDRLRSVGTAGRMALTNYVVQAVIISSLASTQGADLKIRPYLVLPATILVFLILVLLSTFWLRRFSHGPLERIWRSFTLWQWREV